MFFMVETESELATYRIVGQERILVEDNVSWTTYVKVRPYPLERTFHTWFHRVSRPTTLREWMPFVVVNLRVDLDHLPRLIRYAIAAILENPLVKLLNADGFAKLVLAMLADLAAFTRAAFDPEKVFPPVRPPGGKTDLYAPLC